MQKHYIYTPDLNKNYLNFVKGEGIYLYDAKGKKYLDATSGPFASAIGHGRKDMAQALYEQASTLEFAYRTYSINPPLAEVTEKLHNITGYAKFTLVSGGTEANETAFKIARQYYLAKGQPQKQLILGRHFSYHGSSMFTLAAGEHLGFRSDYQPYIKEQAYAAPAYCYRCWYKQKPESCNLECAKSLEDTILQHGSENVAAFFFETISGTSLACAYAKNSGYFQEIVRICRKYEVLLIADEVLVGAGRVGKFNAFELFDFEPDIFTLAKGISSGYIPAAVVAVSEDIISGILEGSGKLGIGFTMTNQPLQAAVILKNLEILEQEKLIEDVQPKSVYLEKHLKELKAKHKFIGDYRGMGLLWGVEFVADQKTKELLPVNWKFTQRVVEIAQDMGLLLLQYEQIVNGRMINNPYFKDILNRQFIKEAMVGDKIMLTPPLTITEGEIDILFSLFDEALTKAERG